MSSSLLRTRFYAGIGSRTTPENVLILMGLASAKLRAEGYILRSGDAKGADKAFAFDLPLGTKEVFRSRDAQPWAFEEAARHLPSDRNGFANWTPFVRGLIARNMMQVLGQDGKTPVDFVLCWAPSLDYRDSSAGGTGYAIRCALTHGIAVYNMYDVLVLEMVRCGTASKAELGKLLRGE